MQRISRSLRHLLLRGLGLLLILSIALVLLYRFLPPPLTPLMVIRLFDDMGITKDWVSYEAIAPALPRAVIAAEDANFCSHWGFDWRALGNAWSRNQTTRHLHGGSTITNQTAKNVFLWPHRDYLRKAIEFYLTGIIELLWPKKRILEVYLNVVEWGPGIYGAEAASLYYFGKPAAALDRSEAAQLAAILPNPRRWSASRPDGYIRARAATLLVRMNDVADTKGDPCRRTLYK